MELQEIRGKDTRELRLDLQALRKEMFGLRFRGASEEVRNTARFRQIRRTIARIHTVLGDRERQALAETQSAAVAAPVAAPKARKGPSRREAKAAANVAKSAAAAASARGKKAQKRTTVKKTRKTSEQ